MEFEYYPSEIANVLCNMTGNHIAGKTYNEVCDALYGLRAAAENPYNHDYFRTLYHVLEQLTERVDQSEIQYVVSCGEAM